MQFKLLGDKKPEGKGALDRVPWKGNWRRTSLLCLSPFPDQHTAECNGGWVLLKLSPFYLLPEGWHPEIKELCSSLPMKTWAEQPPGPCTTRRLDQECKVQAQRGAWTKAEKNDTNCELQRIERHCKSAPLSNAAAILLKAQQFGVG